MKRYIFPMFIMLLCLLTACGYGDGPKLTAGDYAQAALLYDGVGTLTEEEITGRYWRLGEDGSLQSKWEARDGFLDYGTGEEYYLSSSKLEKMFPHPQLYEAIEEYTSTITDGRLYPMENGSILLLKGYDEATLLATLDENSQLTTMYHLWYEEIPPTRVPINYTWNPYAVAPLYDDIYGHRFSADFRAMVGAVLSGEDSFYCSDDENAWRLFQHGREIFPPLNRIVANVFCDDSTGHIIYMVSDSERLEILNRFKESVEELINDTLQQGDTPETMAIALYHAYSSRIYYDYEALEKHNIDVSPYRGLTEYAGICQSFAPAYAYLCTQMGINAVTAGGLSEVGDAHDWTLLVLDGRYYYADTTWEATDMSVGLKYFGLTAQQRYEYGLYLNQYINIANSNTLWGPSIDVSSNRFAQLQQITSVESFRRENGVLTVRGWNANGDSVEFTVN